MIFIKDMPATQLRIGDVVCEDDEHWIVESTKQDVMFKAEGIYVVKDASISAWFPTGRTVDVLRRIP